MSSVLTGELGRKRVCVLTPRYLWANLRSEWLLTPVEEIRMLPCAKISLFMALLPTCLPSVSRDLVQDSGAVTFPAEQG